MGLPRLPIAQQAGNAEGSTVPESITEKPWQARARARKEEALAASIEAGKAFKARAAEQLALLRPILEDIRRDLHELSHGKVIPQEARLLGRLTESGAIVRKADVAYERWLSSSYVIGPVGGDAENHKPIEARELRPRGAKRPEDRKGRDKHK